MIQIKSKPFTPTFRSKVIEGCSLVFLLLVMVSPISSWAQDSTWTLGLTELLYGLEAQHPVGRQAALLPEQAQAGIRMSRGAFDPKLFAGYDQKSFDEKNYWRILGGGVKIPTWMGIEVKGGYEFADGAFLNPQGTLPDQGLLNAGISVPIGKDLLIDDRRATLRQAKIFREASNIERIIMLNDLYFEATSRYWEWVVSYEQLKIFERALEISEDRLDLVRQSFELGDEPAVDTLEAFIQWQTRLLGLQEVQLSFRNTSLILSNFLWDENGLPLEISPGMEPLPFSETPELDPISLDSLTQLIQRMDEVHPEVLNYRFELAALDVERRLKANRLLPSLRLNYNVLNVSLLDPNLESQVNGAFFTENYKWGFSFSFPLFLRKERGSLEMTRLKIEQTGLKRDLKRQEISNKIRSYHNELLTLQQQINLYRATVDNYQKLLAAENLKFRNGESSLFLINSREIKLIEAALKRVALQGKYRKAQASLAWVSGLLYTP